MFAHAIGLSVHAFPCILLSQFLGQMRLKEEVCQCLCLVLGLVPFVTFCNMCSHKLCNLSLHGRSCMICTAHEMLSG